MEDTIEICAGCGKLPRPIDYLNDLFLCSRCGSNKTIMVSSEDYEKTAARLDEKFHKKIIETRIAFVKEGQPPKIAGKKPSKKSKIRKSGPSKTVKKSARKAKPAKKPKTFKKTPGKKTAAKKKLVKKAKKIKKKPRKKK
ncbi:hypothetical protein JXA56_04530 [Candidatus Micrarchaeota archaeon]|nr:hypothetical protein [Candidatus Micrarchaeota archaeon]